jgi:hypothetical protein
MLVVMLPISVSAETPQTQMAPSINVVFIDDRATGLPKGDEVRLNDWSRWERRLPTFIDLLSMVHSFRRDRTGGIDGSATVFGVELAEGLSSERRQVRLADILVQIHAKTMRPSAILARSTKGADQLRFVVQDSIDYTPESAVTFLEVLSEISPLVPPETLGASFGPFTPPPTFIFDPLFPPSHITSDDSSRAVRRWALLEEAYLLPHYVLHAIAVVNANTALLGSTFYPHSSPEAGTAVGTAKRLSDVYIAGAGINSGVDRGETDVLRMTLARARPNPIVVTMDLGQWAQRGLTFNNPRTVTELSTFASLYTRQGKAEGRDVIFDVRSPSDPYLLDKNLPRGVDIVDYMGKATKWKNDSTLQAMAFDSILAAYKDTRPLGKTHLMVDSEAGYSAAKMRETVDRLEFYKARVGPDMAIPVIKRVMDQGGEALIFTGKQDFWSLWNLATKSTAQDVCRTTGCIALHDLTARGIIDHGLPLGERPFEVVSAGGRNRLQLDPTAFSGHALDQKRSYERGGVLFDKGNVYRLDVSGVVRVVAEKAGAAVGESGGVSGVFESGGKTHLAVGIPVGTAKPTPDRIATPVGRFLAVDYRASTAGSLPLALPRLWAKDHGVPVFAGGWAFEVLVAQGMSEFSARRSEGLPRVTIQVFETGNALRYNRHDLGKLPADTATTYVPEGGPFWPDLLRNDDGSYSFRLRHGVIVILDTGGLIKALTSPRGERVDYVRSKAQSLQRQEMGTQSFAIESLAQNPQRVVAAERKRVRYGYSEGRLAEVSAGRRQTLLLYGSGGVLASVEKDGRVFKMQSADEGRLWKVSDNGIEVKTAFRPGDNALELSGCDGVTTIWRLGPRQRVVGVITQGRAVLWTRTSEGRIMQMAIGTLTPKEDGYEFVPLAVAGASL